MNNLDQLKTVPFGLSVITSYSNGKIQAKMQVMSDTKVIVKNSYDHALSNTDNHFSAALKCLEKVKSEHDMEYEIVYYTYNEKDNGYSFIVNRIK